MRHALSVTQAFLALSYLTPPRSDHRVSTEAACVKGKRQGWGGVKTCFDPATQGTSVQRRPEKTCDPELCVFLGGLSRPPSPPNVGFVFRRHPILGCAVCLPTAKVTILPGQEEMVLDIYRNRSKSGKLNNQLGERASRQPDPLVPRPKKARSRSVRRLAAYHDWTTGCHFCISGRSRRVRSLPPPPAARTFPSRRVLSVVALFLPEAMKVVGRCFPSLWR